MHKRLKRGLTIEQLPYDHKVYERLSHPREYYKFGKLDKAAKARFTRRPVILRIKRKRQITEAMALHAKSKISDLKKAIDWEKRDPP